MNLYLVGAWNGEMYEDYNSVDLAVVAFTAEGAIEVAKRDTVYGDWFDWKTQLLAEGVTWLGMPERATALNKEPLH